MERNVGSADRILRLILGVALIVAPLLNLPAIWSVAWMGYGSMIVGAVLVLTSATGMCPIYTVLGLKTCNN